MKLTVASARYAIGKPADFDAFAARVEAAVSSAAAAGAQLVVLPEYLALEAAAGFAPEVRADLARSLAALQPLHPAWESLVLELARRYSVHLQPGTFLREVTPGRYRNRAALVSPEGRIVHQDKLVLTRYERGAGAIEAGDALHAFDTDLGRVGILTCYDVEFPLHARALIEAGVRLILVPSCTDTAAGATRVGIGCQARAMENGVYVVRAVTSGTADWSPVLDTNTGEAAIYTPIDRGFPADGVLARSGDASNLAVAELDSDLLESARRHAQVAIAGDWPTQARPGVAKVDVVPLG